MIKEICAIVTLLMLITGAIATLIHLYDLMKQINLHAEYSALYCSLEDYRAAHEETTKALQLWNLSEGYTQVFIRYTDVDTVYDLFFELLKAIENRDKSDAMYFAKEIKHRTESILNTEKPSVESVF